jgi:signal-transduction protein with cAMP-binding, CBS, and nucleotidyltransferase domain
MRAADLDEQFPIVQLDSDATEAARKIAEHGLPGLVIADASNKPYAVILASEMLHFVLPRYVQDNVSLAGVLGDALADHAQNLAGKTVADLLPKDLRKVPCVDARDGVIKVAAEMSQQRCQLMAVTERGTLHGVITASHLLAAALKS